MGLREVSRKERAQRLLYICFLVSIYQDTPLLCLGMWWVSRRLSAHPFSFDILEKSSRRWKTLDITGPTALSSSKLPPRLHFQVFFFKYLLIERFLSVTIQIRQDPASPSHTDLYFREPLGSEIGLQRALLEDFLMRYLLWWSFHKQPLPPSPMPHKPTFLFTQHSRVRQSCPLPSFSGN